MPGEPSPDSHVAARPNTEPRAPRRWQIFWDNLTRFERKKIIPRIALRNTIGIALPLVIGVASGATLSGVAIASGALNVSFSDGEDPYSQRARRMLASSLLTSAAVVIGGLVGRYQIISIVIATIWALIAGLAVALGTTAADLGVISLVTLVVYAGFPLTFQNAAWAGLLALIGGLFQTALALLLWPIRRYRPERRALGQLYLELSGMATGSISADNAPPLTHASTQAQEILSGLGQDHRIESHRYRSLLSQAERIRLCLLTIARLRRRMDRNEQNSEAIPVLNRLNEVAGDLLYSTGLSLTANESMGMATSDLKRITAITDELRQISRDNLSAFPRALLNDAQLQADALAGQLRAVVELAENATPTGTAAFETRESIKPAALRISNAIATLRANLTLRSTACRHAIRLAACVAMAESLARALDWRRSYWLPMTIVIVLKPDFTSTFSRGVLRLAGTFAGLVLATLLFHFVHPSALLQVAFAALFVYALRSIGPANYGIFVVSISALVVLLVGLTGVAAGQLISARAVNTAAGGLLALLAYWIWPTWERTQVRDAFARMLDAYRAYFRAIAGTYIQPDTAAASLDELRLDARLARSNVEASVDRVSAEPGVSAAQVNLYIGMLASSHRLVHALMALDSGLTRSSPVPAREATKVFARDVDLTLYFLASVLRGSPAVRKQLPDLREDHRLLLLSGDSQTERYALVNIEADRITNSINTFAEQVVRLLAGGEKTASPRDGPALTTLPAGERGGRS
jgi:uncharacterized membrane protein YccC